MTVTANAFAALPRVHLGHFPTPIEEIPALSAAYGVRLLVKREDLSGLAAGGNKVRKLELILASAEAAAADVVMTTGGIQSNHARETAAAAARLQKKTLLFLRGNAPDRLLGNTLLDRLMGAEVKYMGDATYADIHEAMAAEAVRRSQLGQKSYVVPLGGSNWMGVVAWQRGFVEALQQLDELRIRPDAVIVAAGTGSTALGLALGSATSGANIPIWGVSASWSAAELDAETDRLLREVERETVGGLPFNQVKELLFWDDQHVGPGYTEPTSAGQQALNRLAAYGGVIGDLTYTAKALAGLHQLLADGRIRSGATVLYIHTGGSPELHARSTTQLFGDQNLKKG